MNKKGISLIILVITIMVMTILAGTIIIGITEKNPIKQAGKATFVKDVVDLNEQLKISITNEIVDRKIKKPEEVNVTLYEDIIRYMPDFPKKYQGKLIVEKGELKAVSSELSAEQREWLMEYKTIPII